MPEFYIKVARKFFFRISGGGAASLPPVSYAYGLCQTRQPDKISFGMKYEYMTFD